MNDTECKHNVNGHHWRFACHLTEDEESVKDLHSGFTGASEKTINRQQALVKRGFKSRLIFFCSCGKMKTKSVNGILVDSGTYNEQTGLEI